ncbi:MAG: hypothetical protein M1821_001074 [Bathelium mastoideum]|nr:MAG: hypothetical protein M1821_001074 [Bathelium mastoideum]KAI9693901.1 MAG: hypothetical protein M1822_003172 [Bathelium mastoideum]
MDKENANPSSASAAPPAASYTASVAHPSGTSSSSDTSSAPARSGISPGGAAAAAFFPALLLGIALAFLGLWLYRKRRDKVARQPKELRYSDTLSQTARNVSDPIYDPRYGNRTDFLSSARSASDYGAEMSGANPYAPGTGGSQPISGAQSDFSFSPSPPPKTPGTSTSDRVRSIFGRDRLGSSPYYARSPLSPPSAHTRDERAPPPAPIMTQRHTSSETIDVLMPPQASYGNGLDSRGSEPESGSAYGLAPPPRRPGDARNTTFTSMMEQAGFKRSDLTGRESESEPSSGGSGPTSARAPGANERRGYI